MTAPKELDPLLRAMCSVAICCVDEDLPIEAELLFGYLDRKVIPNSHLALANIWQLSQRGYLRDALVSCERELERYPDAEDLQAVAALLRYSNCDPTWRSMCERLLDSPGTTQTSKDFATLLMDGGFHQSRYVKGDVAAEKHTPSDEPGAGFDYASLGAFVRG